MIQEANRGVELAFEFQWHCPRGFVLELSE
jgi:hypothetical protein